MKMKSESMKAKINENETSKEIIESESENNISENMSNDKQ